MGLMMRRVLLTVWILSAFGLQAHMMEAGLAMDMRSNAHEFEFQSIDGDPIKLADFKGKVVLVVNTASQCGFTPQYRELQQLHETYKDKGLVVLGVPSGNFMNQEFDDESEVKEFTEEKFQVTFPLTAINNVKGSEAHPFYRWAGEKAGFVGRPKWNFHKYLIDKQGNFSSWFGTPTSPIAKNVTQAIEKELNK